MAVLFRSAVFFWGGIEGGWNAGNFGHESTCIAISILNGEGFASPFFPPPTGPSIWHPPTVPIILAILFRLFGVCTLASYSAWIVINLAFCFASSLLLGSYAERHLGRRSAVVGQLLYVFNVFELYKFRFTPPTLHNEVYLTLLVLVGLNGFDSLKGNVARGLLGGLLLIGHPMAFIPYSVAVMMTYGYKGLSRKDLTVVLIVIGVTISPLIMRNYVVLGGAALSKSNFFFEAYMGNVPESQGTVTEDMYRRYHPQANAIERRAMAKMGELKYLRMYRKRFLQLVFDDPTRFLQLSFRRAMLFWVDFPGYVRAKHGVPVGWAEVVMQGYFCLALFAIVSSLYRCFIRRTGSVGETTIVIIPLVYSLPYILTHVSMAYRTPIEPIVMILIGKGLVELHAGLSRQGPEGSRNPGRRAS